MSTIYSACTKFIVGLPNHLGIEYTVHSTTLTKLICADTISEESSLTS